MSHYIKKPDGAKKHMNKPQDILCAGKSICYENAHHLFLLF